MNAVLTTFYRCRQHKVGRVLLSVSGPSQKAFQRQHFFCEKGIYSSMNMQLEWYDSTIEKKN